jgi:SAM-dependent methyltransferase
MGMKSPLAKTLLALLLAATIIGLTMSAAIRRGMDHAMPIAAEEQTAIAISLSKSAYDINGYLGLKQVADTIHSYWNRGAQGWHDVAKLIVNFRDAELLNDGIRAAASLGPQTPGYVSDGTLITMNGNDIGQVDYVTLAFRLFGTHVQSLFYLYFTLIGLSAIVFILTFRDNIYALAVLLCTLAAYYIERRLAIFDPVTVPTYFGMRHGSTVALVPMWHFVFLVITARGPTLGVVLGSVIQLAILVLAWRLRGETIWVFGFVILLALVPAFWHLRLRQFRLLRARPAVANRATILWWSTVKFAKSLLPAGQDALRWPVLLLLAGLLGSTLYDRASLHAVYSTDDVMPSRGWWNAAYLGLATYDPGILGSRVEEAVRVRGVDEVGWWGAREYMDRMRFIPWDGKLDPSQPAPGLTSEWVGVGVRTAIQDRMLRGAFMKAVKNHLIRVPIIYLVKKPVHIVATLAKAFTNSIGWIGLSILVGAGVGVLVMRFGDQNDVRVPRDMIMLSGGAVLAAAMPSLWAYPSLSTMGDSVLLLAAFAPIAIGMGSAILLIQRRVGGGKTYQLIRSHWEAQEGTMRAIMAPLYRLAEHTNGYALAQWVSRPTTDRFRALIREQVNPSPGDSLLDVGCGPGHYRSSFACEYSGVDINPDYIEMASTHLDGRFMVMDCTRLEFDDDTFDHVVSVATLHHLTDEQVIQMVREALRVCKSSGRVHILDAILPITPNFAFKRIIFRLDRGAYPRTHEHLWGLIAKAGDIMSREVMAGPLHDVTYVGVAPGA